MYHKPTLPSRVLAWGSALAASLALSGCDLIVMKPHGDTLVDASSQS